MPNKNRNDFPSDWTCLAAGLFARLADSIDRGHLVEASQARTRLASLGFIITFQRERFPRTYQKGGRS